MFNCPPKTSAEMSDRQSKFNSGPFWAAGISSSNLSQSSHFSKWQFYQLLNPKLCWSYSWTLFSLHLLSIGKSSWLYFQNMSRTWWLFLTICIATTLFQAFIISDISVFAGFFFCTLDLFYWVLSTAARLNLLK